MLEKECNHLSGMGKTLHNKSYVNNCAYSEIASKAYKRMLMTTKWHSSQNVSYCFVLYFRFIWFTIWIFPICVDFWGNNIMNSRTNDVFKRILISFHYTSFPTGCLKTIVWGSWNKGSIFYYLQIPFFPLKKWIEPSDSNFAFDYFQRVNVCIQMGMQNIWMKIALKFK